jgi:hypothetical protein
VSSSQAAKSAFLNRQISKRKEKTMATTPFPGRCRALFAGLLACALVREVREIITRKRRRLCTCLNAPVVVVWWWWCACETATHTFVCLQAPAQVDSWNTTNTDVVNATNVTSLELECLVFPLGEAGPKKHARERAVWRSLSVLFCHLFGPPRTNWQKKVLPRDKNGPATNPARGDVQRDVKRDASVHHIRQRQSAGICLSKR